MHTYIHTSIYLNAFLSLSLSFSLALLLSLSLSLFKPIVLYISVSRSLSPRPCCARLSHRSRPARCPAK